MSCPQHLSFLQMEQITPALAAADLPCQSSQVIENLAEGTEDYRLWRQFCQLYSNPSYTDELLIKRMLGFGEKVGLQGQLPYVRFAGQRIARAKVFTTKELNNFLTVFYKENSELYQWQKQILATSLLLRKSNALEPLFVRYLITDDDFWWENIWQPFLKKQSPAKQDILLAESLLCFFDANLRFGTESWQKLFARLAKTVQPEHSKTVMKLWELYYRAQNRLPADTPLFKVALSKRFKFLKGEGADFSNDNLYGIPSSDFRKLIQTTFQRNVVPQDLLPSCQKLLSWWQQQPQKIDWQSNFCQAVAPALGVQASLKTTEGKQAFQAALPKPPPEQSWTHKIVQMLHR